MPYAIAQLRGLPRQGPDRDWRRDVKVWKLSDLYKDYGSSFYEVWSETFIDYTSILVSLFSITALHLQVAFTQFYGTLLQLSKIHN